MHYMVDQLINYVRLAVIDILKWLLRASYVSPEFEVEIKK